MGWRKETTHLEKSRNSSERYHFEQRVPNALKWAKMVFISALFFAFLFADTHYAVALETQFASVYPIVGTRVSSKFGMRKHPVIKKHRHHHGIDLAAPEDALVRSIQSGTVVFADRRGGYGNLIVILHDNGLTSHYGHLNKIKTTIGTRVKAGEVIGLVGSTGRVTGPHLHFEVRENGKPLDPLKLFPHIAQRGKG